jgi:DNA-binding NarL/FixJ family response regulator
VITGRDNLVKRGNSEEDCFLGLTTRERSVLLLTSEGRTNIQIAAELHISRYTVAQHIAKMLRTTGATNRTDLVNRAHRAGILAASESSAIVD